jgi:hypothetical protein
MASVLELIVKLERRLFIIEEQLGIEVDSVNFIHPKSKTQSVAEIAAMKAKLKGIIEEVIK